MEAVGVRQITGMTCGTLMSGVYQSGNMHFDTVPTGMTITRTSLGQSIGSVSGSVIPYRVLNDAGVIRVQFIKFGASGTNLSCAACVQLWGTWE